MKDTQLSTLALLLLGGLAFVLASRLAPYDRAHVPQAGSVAGLLLGGLRESFAAKAFVTADRYFHRGIDHREAGAQGLAGSWFRRMRDRLSPQEVAHRKGDAIREILPWLWFSTHLGSTNIEYALTTAYWLQVSGHPDAAGDMLENLQRTFPTEPSLFLERARVALARDRRDEARRLLTAGLACSHEQPHASSLGDLATTTYDRLLTYRAYLCELDGDTNAAVRLYDEIFEAHPERSAGLALRAARLRAGESVTPTAEVCLRTMVRAIAACPEHGRDHEACDPFDDAPGVGHDREAGRAE